MSPQLQWLPRRKKWNLFNLISFVLFWRKYSRKRTYQRHEMLSTTWQIITGLIGTQTTRNLVPTTATLESFSNSLATGRFSKRLHSIRLFLRCLEDCSDQRVGYRATLHTRSRFLFCDNFHYVFDVSSTIYQPLLSKLFLVLKFNFCEYNLSFLFLFR